MTSFYIREAAGFREAQTSEILSRARALISQRYRTGSPVLTNENRTAEYLRLHVGPLDYEVFGLLHVDQRHRLIHGPDIPALALTSRIQDPRW